MKISAIVSKVERDLVEIQQTLDNEDRNKAVSNPSPLGSVNI